jgi:hypothetical protein
MAFERLVITENLAIFALKGTCMHRRVFYALLERSVVVASRRHFVARGQQLSSLREGYSGHAAEDIGAFVRDY